MQTIEHKSYPVLKLWMPAICLPSTLCLEHLKLPLCLINLPAEWNIWSWPLCVINLPAASHPCLRPIAASPPYQHSCRGHASCVHVLLPWLCPQVWFVWRLCQCEWLPCHLMSLCYETCMYACSWINGALVSRQPHFLCHGFMQRIPSDPQRYM